MFRLIGEMGLHPREVLALQVDDLDFSQQPMRLLVLCNGTAKTTPLPVVPDLERALRHYLDQTGHRIGPLFRAQKGEREEPLGIPSLYRAWKTYSNAANMSLRLRELRESAAKTYYLR